MHDCLSIKIASMNFLCSCNEMLRISFESKSLYELRPSTCCEMKTHRAQSPRVSLGVRFEGMFLHRCSSVLEEEGGQARLLGWAGGEFLLHIVAWGSCPP